MKEPKILLLDAFSSAQMLLAAGLHPDPLRSEELQRSLKLPSRNRGRDPTCKGEGRERERGREGKGEKGERNGREGEGKGKGRKKK